MTREPARCRCFAGALPFELVFLRFSASSPRGVAPGSRPAPRFVPSVQLPCSWRRSFGDALPQPRLAGGWRGPVSASLPFSFSFHGSRHSPAAPRSLRCLSCPLSPRARGIEPPTPGVIQGGYIPSRRLGWSDLVFFCGKSAASPVASCTIKVISRICVTILPLGIPGIWILFFRYGGVWGVLLGCFWGVVGV